MSRIVAALCVAMMATPAAARCRDGKTISWYGEPQRLSGGGRYDPEGKTCASRAAPPGSLLRVTVDGRSAECTVNDYGPAAWTGCEVDVSRRLGRDLDILDRGVARGSVEVLRRGRPVAWALQDRWPGPWGHSDTQK